MRLLSSFPKLAFALVLLSVVGFCVAWRNVELLLVAGVLALLSWYVTEGPRGKHLPRWVSNVLIIAASLNVFVDLLQHRDDMMGVLGRFTVWLTLIKLYERKGARDYGQLLSLSLLLMITSCLQSADLIFGIVLLMYALLGLHVLLLFQLHSAYEQNKELRKALIPADYRLAPPLRPILGRNVGLHFRSLVGSVGLGGLALSVIIFILIPRDIGQGFISALHRAATNGHGPLPQEMNLTTGTRITDSRRTVMLLRVLDAQGNPVHLDEPVLLRGRVLDLYDRREQKWITAPPAQHEPAIRHLTAVPNSTQSLSAWPISGGTTYTQEITLLNNDPALFSMYVPVAFRTDQAVQVEFEPIRQLINIEAGPQLSSYVVTAQPQPSESTMQSIIGIDASRKYDEFVKPRYGNSDVAQLARGILRDAELRVQDLRGSDSTPNWTWSRTAAEAFSEFLKSGQYEYTLDLSDVVDRGGGGTESDPTARFLLSIRRGHCEYFASALAALCQSVKIEARVVMGFMAYEFDDSSMQYTVRESNAHAWVEVRTGLYEWTTLDPTPPATLRQMQATEQTFADRLRLFYDSFEFKWNSNVVTFDSHAQQRLAESFDTGWSARLAGMLADVREFMARVNQAFALGPAGYIWMAFVGSILIIAVIALVKLMRRSSALRRTLRLQHLRGGEYQRMLRQLGFYLDMLAALKRGGCGKPIWQPPRDFADTLSHRRPAAAAIVNEVTDLFYAARYGQERLSGEQVHRARSLVEQLSAALRRK